ncbi:MAG: HlyD family secretion protein [Alphaproteobacteria bacterium]|nr:HlyD family secretion protein [Alphaproteobacteria bacterium]
MTEAEDTPKPPVRRSKRRFTRFFIRLILLVVIPVAAALSGGYFYISGQRYISSENAYIKSDKITISAEISGALTTVAVNEHDVVKKGDLLFTLDSEPFRIAVVEAKAWMKGVRNDVESLRGDYRVKRAELKLAQDDFHYFERTFKRREKLLKRGNVSEERFDQARRNLQRARQKIIITKQEMSRILTTLNGNSNLKAEEYPEYLRASSALDRAELNLKRTFVTAPKSGRVSKIELQPGEYVKSGVPLFSIVADRAFWVEVNLKETKLTYIKVGQRATVEIDAYPDSIWMATVASISPATGAEFAILPPQNATGNWIKVVQRLPVRLHIDDPLGGPPLRTGMSAIIEIDTAREAALPEVTPDFLKDIFAWVRAN